MAALAAIILPFLFGSAACSGDTLLVEERFLGSFGNATRIDVDARGQVIVLDEERDLVIRIGTDGSERQVGGRGWDGSSFDRPTGTATDGLNLYVADYGNHRISRFDRTLTFISAFSTRDTSVIAARFGYPLGVALSRQGDLFILDGENLRVVKFTVLSRFERSFGDRETLRGRLTDPRELLVTRSDRVFVLEPARIVEFDFAGNFVREFGNGVFSRANGFGETRDGLVVCTDSALYWFDARGNHAATTTIRHVLSSQPLTPLRDVAFHDGRIVLLTPRRIGIFRIGP